MCTSDFANSWPANAQIHFPLYLRHYYKESWDDGFSNTIKDMTLDDNLCIGTVTYGWDGRIILARPHISVIAPQTFVWWTIRYLCYKFVLFLPKNKNTSVTEATLRSMTHRDLSYVKAMFRCCKYSRNLSLTSEFRYLKVQAREDTVTDVQFQEAIKL